MDKKDERFFYELGQLIKKAREDKGISQQYLGEKLGKSRNCIANWESGRRTIDIVQLCKICTSLELNVDELINEVKRYVH